jgi:SWI/SNF chromatin-remodeling complex subunit SWI1
VLAKLLARDDPNRAYFKHLFMNDPSASNQNLAPHQQYELLTRAFGLAISITPDRSSLRSMLGGTAGEYRIADARKPQLIQGMLAADILASLVPNSDSGLARSWLEAEDGWAPLLMKMCCSLSADRPGQHPAVRGQRGQPAHPDHDLGFGLVTHRGLSMLQKLGEKTKMDLQTTSTNGMHSQAKEKPAVNGHANPEGSEAKVNGAKEQDPKVDDDDNDDNEEDEEDGPERTRLRLLKTMAEILPQREVLMGALLTPNIDIQALKQLIAFSQLGTSI